MLIAKEYRQSPFKEKIYDVDVDVDYIYSECFKNFVENFKNEPISSFRKQSKSSQVDNCLKHVEGLITISI